VSADVGQRTVVVAIDSDIHAETVEDAGIELARLTGSRVDLIHILETDIVEEQAIDVQTPNEARRHIAEGIDRFSAAGIPATGHRLTVVGDHGGAGRRIADFATGHRAQLIVIGRADDGLVAGAFCDVHIVRFPSSRLGGEANGHFVGTAATT
jgi:hypothetical protein